MEDPLDLVSKKLKEFGSDESTLQLWQDILKWYNEGGPSHLETNLELKFRQIKSQFLKSAREVEPDVRAQKRKVRRKKAKT